MKISQKQAELLQTIKDSPKTGIKEIFLIGPLGTSKTYGKAYALINIAYQFPNSFIQQGRKTLIEARKGTVHSYFEVLDDMGMKQGKHYRFVGGMEIKFMFNNGSVIQFVQLDKTKDREWQSLKSINATAGGIDEVDGVPHDGYTMFTSRVGRKNKNGAPDVTIFTCNPTEAWVKEHIYKPWKKGTLPKHQTVIEFTMTDSFLGKAFYQRYATNPEQWKQRYLYNNWDYLDDASSLFKSKVLDRVTVGEYSMEDEQSGNNYGGQDVAREGKDRSVWAYVVGKTLVDIVVHNKQDLIRFAMPDQKDDPPYGPILGQKIMDYAHEHSLGFERVAIDAVGNGGGVVDYCRLKNFKVNEFKSGATPLGKNTPSYDLRDPEMSWDYDMLRSQMYHQLAEDMKKGEFFLYDGCPYLSELKQELMYHGYEIRDKMMYVEKKDQIKERLGKSPDIADAVVMAYFNIKKQIADPTKDASRIAW